MDLPAGVVTFLFTDIERSTELLKRTGDRYAGILERHREIMRAAVEGAGGIELGTEGDSFFVVFGDASAGLAAAVAAQRQLAAEAWPDDGVVRVRMGLHTGTAARAGGSYVGIAVHEAARIADAAHGGQVVCSAATLDAADGLPDGASVRALGAHRLKDLDDEIFIHQICHPEMASTFPALRSIVSTTGALPTFASTFVGRAAELAALAILVRERRLVTIVGPPGVGKTRVAVELARMLASERQSGARLIDLGPVESGDALVGGVAAVLGIREQQHVSRVDAIVASLVDSDACLVFDNCEHLLDDVANLVDRIAVHCPGLRLLLTSREPLEVDGETVWQLAPLEEAAELFVARAALARPDIRLDVNDVLVREICARVDGLPLAVELAAAQVRRQTVAEISEDLAHRFNLLDRSTRGAAKRYATLRAAIEWSYAQLDPSHADFLDQLSVFPGTFDAAVAAAVTGREGVASMLDRLVDRSLVAVSADHDHTRYRLLSTIRAAARDRLDNNSERARLAAAHAKHFRSCAALLAGTADPAAVDVAARDIDDHRSALGWFRSHDGVEGLAYAVDMDAVWWSKSDPREGLKLLGEFVSGTPTAPSVLRASALTILADMSRRQGRFADARSHAEEALQLDSDAGASRGIVPARFVLASVLSMQGHLDEAERHFEQSLARAAAAGDDVGLIAARGGLAMLAVERGDVASARAMVDLATADALRVHNRWAEGMLKGFDAKIRALEGRLDEARLLFEELIPNAQIGGLNAVAETSRQLATVLRMQGDYAPAVELLDEARRIFEVEGDVGGVAHVVTELGIIQGELGDHERAVELLNEAKVLRDGVGIATPGSEVADIERTLAACC